MTAMGYRPRFSFTSPSNPVSAGSSTGPHLRAPQSTGYVFRPRNVDGVTFDGKRMRNKSVLRRTVDYNPSVMNYLEDRVWQRDNRDARAIQPDALYQTKMLPPHNLIHKPMNCVTTKFVRTSTNKIRCPIFCVCWTPEGRRLITGASSGEFTLWNGLTFNFETILQAHDSAVRAMIWSHSNAWMLTADHGGFVKYWQSNMNNVKMYQAHKDPVRGLSFCPTDAKFASCSDDGTVRIWDFLRCHEERILRGHGADVKCVDWHPQKALIASGSKDTQQPLKLWDPRMGNSLATIHAHKHTVMELKWNRNGNWLLTASRDHLLKLFDVRNMKEEMQAFKGHKKEATAISWHPINEVLFASGGSDGAMMFWLVGSEKEVGSIEEAHETMVWSLSWHPLGHILVSGSNDHTTKFWTRNRPGDAMRDKYNLNTMPVGMAEDMLEFDLDPTTMPSLPGMGLEKGMADANKENKNDDASIPGLDFSSQNASATARFLQRRKIPYAKPIPKDFESAWSGGKQPLVITRSTRVANGEPTNSTDAERPGLMGPPRQPGPSGRGPSITDGKGPMDHRPGLMGPPRPPGPPGQYGMRGPRPWGQQGPRGPPPKGLLGHSPWDHGSGPRPRGPGPQGPRGPGDMHGQQDQGFRHQGMRPMRPPGPGPQQMENNGQPQQQYQQQQQQQQQQNQQQQGEMWTNHQQPQHQQQQQQQPYSKDTDQRLGRNVESQNSGEHEFNDVDDRVIASGGSGGSGGPSQYDSSYQDGGSTGRGGFGYQDYGRGRGRGRGYSDQEGMSRGRPQSRGGMSAPPGQFQGQHPPPLLSTPTGKRAWEEGPGAAGEQQGFSAPNTEQEQGGMMHGGTRDVYERGASRGNMEQGGMQRGNMEQGGMQRGNMEQGGIQHGNMEQGGMQCGNMEQGGMQRGGMDQGGMQRGRMDQGGMQCGGMDQSGMQQSGMQRGGMDQGEMQQSGMQRGGMDQSGMQHGGMDQGGMQQGEMQRGRMDQSGMQQSGMQHGGMDQSGMQQGGMQRGGMDQSGMQQGGMQRGGMDQSGMQQGGMQRGGMDQSGMQQGDMQRGAMEQGGMQRGGMQGGMGRGSPRGRGVRGAPWGGPRGGMGR